MSRFCYGSWLPEPLFSFFMIYYANLLQVPEKSHGTAMLAQICGKDLGLAKDIWPVLYNWEYQNDKKWVLDVLDYVYTDFMAANMASPDTARLAVLNLSFSIETIEQSWIKRFQDILKKLIAVGVLPVASAGNNGVVSHINPWKASSQKQLLTDDI
jgi:hypothetical protein